MQPGKKYTAAGWPYCYTITIREFTLQYLDKAIKIPIFEGGPKL